MQSRFSPAHAISTPRQRKGFSLVEVLIALVVLSVGMLGVAGLYVQSMQASRTSMLRHHAVILAGDVADRIRANPNAGAAYQGSGRDNDCVSGFVNCDETAMAGQDILAWKQQAAEALPDGDVQVTFDASGDLPTYLIVVIWSEPGASGQPFYSLSIPVLSI
ncbi:MAG: type IV pilus modification protein PilV [Woeseiaceae bacterium]